jgi:hypothetical protein
MQIFYFCIFSEHTLEPKVKDIYGAHPAVTMMQKRTHLSRKYLRNLITEAEKGLLE